MKCPDGADSWCFYKKAIAMDKVPKLHKQRARVPLDVNESLHNVIWSMCPKYSIYGIP